MSIMLLDKEHRHSSFIILLILNAVSRMKRPHYPIEIRVLKYVRLAAESKFLAWQAATGVTSVLNLEHQ